MLHALPLTLALARALLHALALARALLLALVHALARALLHALALARALLLALTLVHALARALLHALALARAPLHALARARARDLLPPPAGHRVLQHCATRGQSQRHARPTHGVRRATGRRAVGLHRLLHKARDAQARHRARDPRKAQMSQAGQGRAIRPQSRP